MIADPTASPSPPPAAIAIDTEAPCEGSASARAEPDAWPLGAGLLTAGLLALFVVAPFALVLVPTDPAAGAAITIVLIATARHRLDLTVDAVAAIRSGLPARSGGSSWQISTPWASLSVDTGGAGDRIGDPARQRLRER